jgi:hypothetical protein
VRNAEGLSNGQARRAACPPRTLILLGLIGHTTDVQRWWFPRGHLANDVPALIEEQQWQLPADATVVDAVVACWAEIA